MWWKALSVVLIVYSLIAGTLVPLKPGITYVSPQTARSGQQLVLQLHGYNSFYAQSPANDIRVWLQYDSAQALTGQQIRVLNDTTLEASFLIPTELPRPTASVMLNAIIDHPADGVSLLPSAIEIVKDSIASQANWSGSNISGLHVKKDFSFPYRNVIYESIRNTYFHVPMWFVLMFLFIASAWNSVQFLRFSNPAQAAALDEQKGRSLLDFDRKAAAYAEAGLLFGILGLITGMLWAHYAWGAAWSNDIKQLMTAVALLIYLAYFILRSSFDEPEKGARLAAVYNIFAFASLIPLLYIVPRMFASLHPGATGNPAFGSEDLDNTMRMVFYPAIIGWSLFGFWLAQLRYRYQRLLDKATGLD
ncbi:MAG: cytochrome c biogenesis protein CcsA [Saprospiraceae bacterium]|nr:cytochrome c biogenesis protein CcsA [Saprospiraceae bacterium]